jgi:hypothetical protein
MNSGSGTTYGSADIARACGLKRPTLDQWLLAKYIPLEPGRGTGNARRYSALDALRVAALSHMTFLGMLPSRASSYVAAIKRMPDPGDRLVLTGDPISRRSLAVVLPSGGDIHETVALAAQQDAAGSQITPPGSYVLDLHALAVQVERSLRDPDWREHHQPEVRVVLTRWPADPTEDEIEAVRHQLETGKSKRQQVPVKRAARKPQDLVDA